MFKTLSCLCTLFIFLISPILSQELFTKGLGLGEVTYDQAASELQESIGVPDLKGEKTVEEASGKILEEWHYGKLGLFVEMAQDSPDSPQRVYRLYATEPCTWKWLDLVGIGSTRTELHQVFNSFPTDDSLEILRQEDEGYAVLFRKAYVVVGFEIVGERVTEIFLGPGAE